MDIQSIILVLVILIFLIEEIILMVYFVPNLKLSKKETKEKESSKINEVKILLEDKSLEKIDDVVDGLIKNAVDIYMVLNVNFNTDAYLNDDSIKELTQYAFGMVKRNMTPSVMELIGLTNDISTEEKLNEYLNLKIKMYILAVVVKTNQ